MSPRSPEACAVRRSCSECTSDARHGLGVAPVPYRRCTFFKRCPRCGIKAVSVRWRTVPFMSSNEAPTGDELRAVFEHALADAIAGKGVPQGIGLDDETTTALLAVDSAAPNPSGELIRFARDEFEELLEDLASVDARRQGDAIPFSEVLARLGISLDE